MSWSSFFDAIGELGNTVTFGGTDRFAQLVTGASDEQLERMRAARAENAGVAGDVANAAGTVYALPRLVAAPIIRGGWRMAAPAATTSSRATALGVGANPSRYAQAHAAVGRFGTRVNPGLRTAAIGTPVLAMGSYNARTDPDGAVAAPAAAGEGAPVLLMPRETDAQGNTFQRVDPRMNTAAIAALPKDANGNRSVYSDAGYRAVLDANRQRQGGQAAPAAPAAPAQEMSSFERAATAYAAQNGGISLQELAQLAEIDRNGRPDPRPRVSAPSARDQIMATVQGMSEQTVSATQANILQRMEAGEITQQQAQTEMADALDEHRKRLQALVGAEEPILAPRAAGNRG